MLISIIRFQVDSAKPAEEPKAIAPPETKKSVEPASVWETLKVSAAVTNLRKK